VKQKDKTKLGWIVAILILALFANQMGYLGPRINIPGLTVEPKPEEKPAPTYVAGIVTTNVAAYDSLDIATSRTVGTNVKVYWYVYRNGWVLLGTGSSADLSIQKEDYNIVYAVVSVPSGQNFYVDYAKIQNMNSRVQSIEYKDVDGDNVKEYVFRLNIADSPYATGTGKYNMPLFTVYLLGYDSSHSISSPADITSVGTAKVTKHVEWYTTMSAEKKALAISRVVLIVNTSDTSKVALKKLNIPGIGNLDGSSFDQDVLSDQTKWTYRISSILYGADYIKLPAGTLNKFDFATQLELKLSSGDVLTFTLYIYYLDATESQASLSDAVNVSA